MNKTILVVDDDQDIVTLIEKSLSLEQMNVITASKGLDALDKLEQEKSIDFIVLDVMMPNMDGLEVCRRIRETSNIPILFLSAKGSEIDKIIGLEIGADDYMTKPFSVAELVSRIKAHFRKTDRLYKEWNKSNLTSNNDSNTPLVLVEDSYEAFLNGEKLDLSTKEFQILSFLVQHSNQVYLVNKYMKIYGETVMEISIQ